MDAETLTSVARASRCRVIVPAAWRARAIGFGIDPSRIVGVDDGDDLEPLPGLRVRPVLAAHEELRRDDAGHSLFLGYVVTIDGVTIYHSGDCVPFGGQIEMLSGLGVDVALLPVNGRDAERLAHGVPGNFLPAEAVRLAGQIGADVLVGHHFGLFAFNTVDERLLSDAVAGMPDSTSWVRPEVGRRVALVPAH
jgi:L-ascorbate metabolism protein UlaG (beta-lactamase superfamily)